MIEFINPYAFWALAAILPPIIVHFLNNKSRNIKQVPTVRFFTEEKKSRAVSVSFNDIYLFLIRILMLSLLTLFFFQPALKLTSNSKKKTVLSSNSSLLGSNYNDYETRELDTEKNLWTILETYDKSNDRPDTVIIHTNLDLNRFSGEKYIPSFQTKWLNINNFSLDYVYIKKDSIIILKENDTNFQRWSFLIEDQKNISVYKQNYQINLKNSKVYLNNRHIEKEIKTLAPKKITILGEASDPIYSLCKKAISLLALEDIISTEISDLNHAPLDTLRFLRRQNGYEFSFNGKVFKSKFKNDKDIQNFIWYLRDNLFNAKLDKYKLNHDQLKPETLNAITGHGQKPGNKLYHINLKIYLVILFLLLFLSERYISLRKRAR